MGLSLKDIVRDMERNYATNKGTHRKLANLDPCEIYNPQIIGRPGAFTVQFTGEAQSSGDHRYNVKINFFNKNFSKFKDPKFPLETVVGDEVLYFEQPMQEDMVAVGCGCQDFLKVWAMALYDKGACAINLNQYSSREFLSDRNPNNAVGICKHLWAFVQELQNGGYIR